MTSSEIQFFETRAERFVALVENRIYGEEAPLEAVFRRTVEPVSFPQREEGQAQQARVGDVWGRNWESAWFRL